MKKLNSLIAFKSALLTLLMMVLAIPAWAGYCIYDSSTKCLKVYGGFDHSICYDDVKKVTESKLATSIWFDSTVEIIYDYAFASMSELQSVTIPSTVRIIYYNAFVNCPNLKTVRFEAGQEGLYYINDFQEDVDGPSIVGDGLFENSGVETVYCDRDVYGYWSTIGNRTEDMNFPPLFKENTTVKKIEIGPNMTYINRGLFKYCKGLTTLDLSNATKLNSIGKYAFQGSALKTVLTYSNITIDEEAFPTTTAVINANATYQEWLDSYKNKTTVIELYIPNDNVANYASFTASDNLTTQFPKVKKVTFSPSVTTIGNNIFYGSKTLETLVFEGDPVAVGQRAFQDCVKLATIGKVKSVDQHSFANCTSLKSIEITNDTNIEMAAFTGCSSLESATLPSNLISIQNNAFGNCTALKEVSFPNSVETIKIAYKGCTALEKVTFRKNVKEISNSAFSGCTALKKVTFMLSEDIVAANYTATSNLATRFPYAESFTLGSIENIGDYAFAGSSALKTISSATSIKSIGTGAFANCTNLSYVPYSYWISTLETIGANAFENCQSLTEFYVSDQITELKANTFKGCTGLKIMTLGTRLAAIDKTAVEGCTNLTDLRIVSTTLASKDWGVSENLYTIFPNVTDLTFGPSVTKVGDLAFFDISLNSKALKNITFQNVPTIGQSAFYGQTGLEQITGNINNVGESAFFQCSSLQSVAFSNDATEIGNAAFYWCSSLQSVALTDNVTKIGNVAFFNCSSLNSITLPNKLTTIGGNAFDGCTNLKSVTFNGSNITPDNEEKQWTSNYNFCTIFPYVERIAFAPAARLVASTAFSCGVNKNSHPLKSVRFWGITEVEKDAFYNQANLTTVEGRLKSAGESAFEGTSIESITFDDTYATPTIGNNAFAYCSSLKTVKLSNRIETIGSMAFFRCASLTEIVIPDRVSEIQDLAFFDSGLNKVICHREEPISISTVVFDGYIMQRAELLVPAASIAAYKAAPVWQDFYKISASDAITIADGTAYTNDQDILVPAVRYTRTFSEKTAGKWQCLYVPFDIPVTEELLKDFEFAKLYMISQRDENNNGEIEDGEPLVMLINKFSAGKTLKANTPYFIKAKTAGTKNIEVMETTTIHAAASGYVDCSTTENYYKLVGTNETFNVKGNYTLNTSGQFDYYSKDTNLKANRWYMSITSRTDGNPVYVSRPIEILVDGEDDATGIMDIRADRSSRSAEGIFTLDGRKISDTENLPSGIYIKNGKKVVIK